MAAIAYVAMSIAGAVHGSSHIAALSDSACDRAADDGACEGSDVPCERRTPSGDESGHGDAGCYLCAHNPLTFLCLDCPLEVAAPAGAAAPFAERADGQIRPAVRVGYGLRAPPLA